MSASSLVRSNVALIPARQGSKRLPDKNITLLCGKPLVAHAVDVAAESGVFDEIYVSTDDTRVMDIARGRGVCVVERPPELCADTVVLDQVVSHFVDHLDAEGTCYGAVCLMTPTAPLRTADDVRGAVGLLWQRDVDFVVSVVEYDHSPYYAVKINGEVLEPAFMLEAFTKDRNLLPRLYRPIATARVGKWEAIRKHRTTFGPGMIPYIVDAEHAVDVDSPIDFALAELLLSRRQNVEQ